MNYVIGQKVWIPNCLTYKTIIDIEIHDKIILLYMNDITAYPDYKVYYSFNDYFKTTKLFNLFKKKPKIVKKTDYDIVVDYFKNEVFKDITNEEMDKIYEDMWGK